MKISSPRAEAKHRGQRQKRICVRARYDLLSMYRSRVVGQHALTIPPHTTPCTTSPVPTPVPRFPCQPPAPSTPCTPSLSLTPVPHRCPYRTDFPPPRPWPHRHGRMGRASPSQIQSPAFDAFPALAISLTVAAEGVGGCGGGGDCGRDGGQGGGPAPPPSGNANATGTSLFP